MNYFQTQLVKLLNKYFQDNQIQAIAYRSKQSKFNLQFYDILVDSADPDYYLAIQCKSCKAKDVYFKKYFRQSQITNLSYFKHKSGRTCFLATKYARDIFILPWQNVVTLHQSQPKISYSDLIPYIIGKQTDWLKQHLYICRT